MTVAERIAGLDGLRAIALASVLAFHASGQAAGWAGVWLFYVLSGFVITRSLTTNQQGQPVGRAYTAFLKRRAVRLLPAYAVYLAVVALILVASGPQVELGQFVFLLTFTDNINRSLELFPSGAYLLGHLWSLSVEEQFYLLFPFLVLTTLRRRALLICLIAMMAVPALRFAVSIATQSSGWSLPSVSRLIYFSMALHVDAFLLGALLALRPHLLVEQRWIAPALLLSGMTVLAVAVAMSATGRVAWVFWHDRVDVPATAIAQMLPMAWFDASQYLGFTLCSAGLIAAVVQDRTSVRWLSGRALVAVGRISYSGYLYHQLAIVAVIGLFGPTLTQSVAGAGLCFVLSFAVTLAFATASWRYVEQPTAKPARPWLSEYSGAYRQNSATSI